MNIGSNFIGEVTDFIQELKDTGELKYILEKSPELLKASLEYELEKVKTLEKMSPLFEPAITFMKYMTKFLEGIGSLIDTFTGKDETSNKIAKNLGETALRMSGGSNVVNAINGASYIRELFKGNNDNSPNVRKYNDYTAEAIIEKAKNIKKKDKETVKEMIEHDSVNNYEINVTAGASGEDIARQLVQAIKNIQNNR